VLTNVTITGNNASTGGGMNNNEYSLPVLTNVTIAGNSATDGGGMYNYSSSPKIRNSVVWGNSGGGIYTAIGTPEVSYSIVQEGWTGTGSDNKNADPEFVSPQNASAAPTAAGDYRLRANSPAINAGDDGYYNPGETPDLSAIGTDLDGNPRKIGSAIDMGAYEEQVGVTPGNAAITLSIDRGQGTFSQGSFTVSIDGDPHPQTQTVTVTGAGSSPRWFVDGVQKAAGNSITVDAADYTAGGHSLSLWLELNDAPWSKEIDFTVTD
jgi:hypothetical protein